MNMRNPLFLARMLAPALFLAWTAHAQEPATNAVSTASKNFRFEGGSFQSFISAVKAQLNVDLEKEATIDYPGWLNLQIPKMSVRAATPEPLRDVLDTYNVVSRAADGRIGRWALAMDFPSKGVFEPHAIMFIPPVESQSDAEMETKAFAIADLSDQDRGTLIEEIRMKADEFSARAEHEQASAFQRIGPQRQTGPRGLIAMLHNQDILLVSGNKSFVELAAAVVEAYKDLAHFKRTELPSAAARTRPAKQ